MLLASTYLEIKYQNKIYKLEELYNKFKNELNLNEYSKDILEFDIDEKMQYLREYNSK